MKEELENYVRDITLVYIRCARNIVYDYESDLDNITNSIKRKLIDKFKGKSMLYVMHTIFGKEKFKDFVFYVCVYDYSFSNGYTDINNIYNKEIKYFKNIII